MIPFLSIFPSVYLSENCIRQFFKHSIVFNFFRVVSCFDFLFGVYLFFFTVFFLVFAIGFETLNELDKLASSGVWVFIAQLVEHCHGF